MPSSDIHEFLASLPNSNLSIAIAMEAHRLATKYNADVFTAEDLTNILGVGMNNARELMNAPSFPTIHFKGRKVVSALGLAAWFVRKYMK